MILNTSRCKVNILYSENPFESSKVPLICLHGFTGCARDWEPIFSEFDSPFNPIAIDLPGHGESESPSDLAVYTAEGLAKLMDEVFETLNLKNLVLLGYSMGGRAALSYIAHKKSNSKINLLGLILESASAGIEDPVEKQKRVKSDEQLGKFLTQFGIEKFIEKWYAAPMWESLKQLPEQKLRNLFDSRLKNNSIGLAKSIQSFGTGKMNYVGDTLGTITSPVLLITGELDSKFNAINKSLLPLFKKAEHVIVPKAGHNTHLENPNDFLNFTNLFLRNLTY